MLFDPTITTVYTQNRQLSPSAQTLVTARRVRVTTRQELTALLPKAGRLNCLIQVVEPHPLLNTNNVIQN